jgi:hypothetical protein
MRKIVIGLLNFWLVTAVMLVGFLPHSLVAQAAKPAPPPPKLKVGDTAPDFKLKYFDGTGLKEVSLSQYRGQKNVVLAFYVFAFTGG